MKQAGAVRPRPRPSVRSTVLGTRDVPLPVELSPADPVS